MIRESPAKKTVFLGGRFSYHFIVLNGAVFETGIYFNDTRISRQTMHGGWFTYHFIVKQIQLSWFIERGCIWDRDFFNDLLMIY